MSYIRKIIPVIADTHGGYLFGLLNPKTELPPFEDISPEPFKPKLTPTQEMIWELFVKDKQEIVRLAGDDEIFLIHVGDVTQGTLLRNQMLVTPRLADQLLIAKDVISTWIELPNLKTARFVKGSGIHSMKHGSSELELAHYFRKKYNKDIQAWYHMILDIDNVIIDVAHKGSTSGKRKWLEGNEVRRYIQDIALKEIINGRRPPDIVLRGHYHDRVMATAHIHTDKLTHHIWGAICPAYSLFGTDDWTKSATASKGYMTVGTLALEIINNKLIEIHDFTHSIDIRRHEIYDRN